jgi:hypothetical protein
VLDRHRDVAKNTQGTLAQPLELKRPRRVIRTDDELLGAHGLPAHLDAAASLGANDAARFA